jgi:GNAT superfamily N-acetyltransferase
MTPTAVGAGTVHLAPLAAELLAATLAVQRAAFPQAESTRLGAGYEAALLHWFVRRPVVLSRAALRDGRVCGFVIGASAAELPALYRHLVPAAARGLARRPWLLLRADVARMMIARLARLVGRASAATTADTRVGLKAPVVVLHTIGVAPAEQRRGVGQALLAGFVDAAAAWGARSLRLSALLAEAHVCRFYERHGWTELPSRSPARVDYELTLGNG